MKTYEYVYKYLEMFKYRIPSGHGYSFLCWVLSVSKEQCHQMSKRVTVPKLILNRRCLIHGF